jgi:hypothetical protein
MAGTPEQQMERYSRAWVVAAASAADFTYEIPMDDVHGIDMVVRSDLGVVDFQLKSTSNPDEDEEELKYDLDVRTYNLLREEKRAGYAVLALIVVDADRAKWLTGDHRHTRLVRSAYYLELFGMPSTTNSTKIRLRIPKSNLLTIAAMKTLMSASESRWA